MLLIAKLAENWVLGCADTGAKPIQTSQTKSEVGIGLFPRR